MSYFPLHCHSTYSLLDGLSQAHQITARVRKLGLGGSAISDHGSVSGVPSFIHAMKGACKNCGHQEDKHGNGGKGACLVAGETCEAYEPAPLKSILGSEFYLCKQDAAIRAQENRQLSHLVVLAKNRDGWRNLIKATSAANHPDHFYYKPRLDLEKLASFASNQWIAFSGHPGSDLADACFLDPRAAYGATSEERARELLKPWPDLKRDLTALAGRYRDLFGRDNFFVEVQLIDAVNTPAAAVVAKAMRWVSKELGIPALATPDAHYPAAEDAVDQRVLLCSAVDTTLAEVGAKLADAEEVGLGGFFRSNRYHIPSFAEMAAVHEQGELDNTLRVAEMCEAYDITNPPRLPDFVGPSGQAPEEYLTQLCRNGWRRKIVGKIPKDKLDAYGDRVKRELGVLKEFGLSSYFLIVHDYCNYAQTALGCKVPRGRGSAAGCLVSHLLDITDCDPIEHGLLFERFLNPGRLSKAKFSPPDIDVDFPITKRDQVFDYIRKKHGETYVAQMATFGRMQGREALSAVFRAHSWGSFEERKAVTSHIPDIAKVADDLQEMREETGEASVLRWALEFNAKGLKDYVSENEDGTLEGPLARYFEQALRLEGTRRTQGKHAAGIIISPVPVAEVCPMLYDKSSGHMVAGFEMNDVERLGLLKMDVLSLAVLDKTQGTVKTLAGGPVGVF